MWQSEEIMTDWVSGVVPEICSVCFFSLVLRNWEKNEHKEQLQLPTTPLCVFTQTKHLHLESTQRRQKSVVITDCNSLLILCASKQGKGFTSPSGVLVSAYKNFSSPHSLLYNKRKPETELESLPTWCMQEACEEESDRREKRLMSVRRLKSVPLLRIE